MGLFARVSERALFERLSTPDAAGPGAAAPGLPTAASASIAIIRLIWRRGRVAEGGGLLNRYTGKPVSRVRIPPSPPLDVFLPCFGAS